MERSIVRIAAAMVRKSYRAKNFILSRSNGMNKSRFFTSLILILLVGCNRPVSSSPAPDLFATLQASTPSGGSSPAPGEVLLTPTLNPSSPNPSSGGSTGGSTAPQPSSEDGLTGHIVFTCQLFKVQAMDQICIMNADGSG